MIGSISVLQSEAWRKLSREQNCQKYLQTLLKGKEWSIWWWLSFPSLGDHCQSPKWYVCSYKFGWLVISYVGGICDLCLFEQVLGGLGVGSLTVSQGLLYPKLLWHTHHAHGLLYYLVRYCLFKSLINQTLFKFIDTIYCWVYLETFLVTSHISNWMNYFFNLRGSGKVRVKVMRPLQLFLSWWKRKRRRIRRIRSLKPC